MGKRELILVAVFALVGAVAWRLTSGPFHTGSGGQQLGKAWRNIRAELSGDHASVDIERRASAALPPGRTLAIGDVPGPIRVSGGDRSDVEVELRATIRAADQTEAVALGEALTLTLEPDGELLRLRVTTPDAHESARLELRVLVPRDAVLKVTHRRHDLSVDLVKSVELGLRRVDARLSQIAAAVTGEQTDGELVVAGAGALALNLRRVDARVEAIAGGVKGELVEGQFTGRRIDGPVSLEGQRTAIELEEVAGAVTLGATDSRLEVRGARDVLKFDGKRSNLVVAAGALRDLDVTGQDGDVEVTLGEAGAVIDLATEEGHIRLPDASIAVTESQSTRRAGGTLGRGGARLRARVTDGDIVVRR